MKKITIFIILTFLILACQHHSDASQPMDKSVNKKYQHIIQYAKNHKTLRLIISYKIDDLANKPDTEITAIIHKKGSQILKSIPSATLIRQYDTVPAIAVVIHKKDLNTLTSNQDITTIQLDALAKPMMSNTRN